MGSCMLIKPSSKTKSYDSASGGATCNAGAALGTGRDTCGVALLIEGKDEL
jgi:hypothetical protein